MNVCHPTSNDAQRPIFVALAGSVAVFALAGCVLALGALTIDRNPDAGPANLAALRPFWIASACSWAALTAVLYAVRNARVRSTPHFVGVAGFVLATSLAARVAVVVTHDVGLSDDIFRYVLDGGNAAAGINPYMVTPESTGAVPDDRRHDANGANIAAWPGARAVAARVNNPELHTIYLPTSQWCFMAAGVFVLDSTDAESAARVYRVWFVVLEFAAMVLIGVALFVRRRTAWWLAAYAWHPLPLAEIAGSGHQDVIGVALLAGAAALYTCWPRRYPPWIIALALAGMVKPIVVPAAGILLKGRPVAAWLASLMIGAAVTALVSAPLLLAHGGMPIEHLGDTATRFSLKWAHFGSVYEPLLWIIERWTPTWGNDPQEQLARGICTGLLAVVVALVLWRGRDPWTSCAGLFLAMVLLTPAAHPWYLLWALILAPLRVHPAVWVASLTMTWGYAVLGNTAEWTVAPWVMFVAYAPIYTALVVNMLLERRRGRRAAPPACSAD